MNGLEAKKVILYARVSTEEQARTGYSLAQQLEALRDYAVHEGYEVLEEVLDPGQSGASLERSGMDRVRDLVTAGGVYAVLAQDRDRFSREPAYSYLLKKEFEEHGTLLRSLGDRGDDSPEGQLTDGIIDQIAKFERAKTAERSRRGKLRKAREGKIIASKRTNYGFRLNESRDCLEVDEEQIRVVRRIFCMVGVENIGLYTVGKMLETEGISAPGGGKHWYKHTIRTFIFEDVYKPHTYCELEPLLSATVAARLDKTKSYGIWWFNRRKYSVSTVSEPGLHGRIYKKKHRVTRRDPEEHVAVPVPGGEATGIYREWVDAARDAVLSYRPPSKVGKGFWELSGALMRCEECGRAMEPVDRYYKTGKGEKGKICYYRCREGNRRKDTCSNRKSIRSDRAHAAVWDLISGIMQDPAGLREELDAMIEQKRSQIHDDPESGRKRWLSKLAELERKRSGFQDMAAEGLISFDELRVKLAGLEESQVFARAELQSIEEQSNEVAELERDRDSILEDYTAAAPEALESLTREQRHELYKRLRLKLIAHGDGSLTVEGPFPTASMLGANELVQTYSTRHRYRMEVCLPSRTIVRSRCS